MELCTNTGHMAWKYSENPKCVLASSWSPFFEKVGVIFTSLLASCVVLFSPTCCNPNLSAITDASRTLRCHIYDNQSIIHLSALPLPCVDPTAMLPAHIWLRGAAAQSWMRFAPGDGASGRPDEAEA